ncbi:hypothetical protein [Bradyrhizobium sp. Ai1a-2]|uniref:hypothetical protein n=1 Tax=Bradyrhizobium sp. Ai1a-2 TaxID=196490 RepID=UPI0012679864|nr:hypothetical protein [Bradyrhizobium sp. Ai1a-2]
MTNINANGSATGRPRQSALSLLRQHLDKRQLAAKLACILEGDVDLVPTARQLAEWFGVNETYIRVVRAMPPEKRHAIASGEIWWINLSALSRAPKIPSLSKPTTTNGKLDDSVLFAMVHEAGVDKILAVAAQVEAHHQAH